MYAEIKSDNKKKTMTLTLTHVVSSLKSHTLVQDQICARDRARQGECWQAIEKNNRENE